MTTTTDPTSDARTKAFFLDSGSDPLRLIYWWARARYAAPWAVLGAVLLRVAASVGPHVQLPGLIGGRASINLLCAFVSASGGGKGISDKVARLAWPTPVLELPIGSGEGIAATFKRPDKPGADDEPITAAIFMVPEIDTLAGIASRQGSILLAQLKSMAMGEQLGQSNASKATSRIVAAHSYRCCLSVGAQPGHTGVLFDDTTGGTPQRFLWFPTTDPDMPATAAPDAEPLNTAIPLWAPGEDGVVEISYGPPEIAETIIAAHIARQRGLADALDGHSMLTRCKVAAVLAIMHARSVVSEWDWQRSADIMAVSDHTRDWIVTEASRAARAKVRDRAVARATGDAIYDDRVLEGVKRSLLRMLERDGEQPLNKLRSRLGKHEKRALFEQAIDLLQGEGLVSEREDFYNGAKRVRYRIGSGLTKEVSPGKPSSEGVTQLVRPDLSATVTEIDTRRSEEKTARRLSAPKWLAGHVTQLRESGIQYIATFAVYEAGRAAGYSKSDIGNAARLCQDVRIAARKGTTTWWCIDPAEVLTYRPAREFVVEYLDALPAGANEVDQVDFYTAVDAAGIDRNTARSALTQSERIESLPAHGRSTSERIWRITEQEAS